MNRRLKALFTTHSSIILDDSPLIMVSLIPSPKSWWYHFMDNVCLKNKNQMEHISLALAIISNHLHPCFWNTISALSDRRSQKAHPLPIPPTAGMSVRGRDIGRSCVCCILTSVARSSSDSLGDQVVFKKRPRNFIGIIYGFMPLEFDMV